MANTDDETVVVTRGQLKAFEAAVRRREVARFAVTRMFDEGKRVEGAIADAQAEETNACDGLRAAIDSLYGKAAP